MNPSIHPVKICKRPQFSYSPAKKTFKTYCSWCARCPTVAIPKDLSLCWWCTFEDYLVKDSPGTLCACLTPSLPSKTSQWYPFKQFCVLCRKWTL